MWALPRCSDLDRGERGRLSTTCCKAATRVSATIMATPTSGHRRSKRTRRRPSANKPLAGRPSFMATVTLASLFSPGAALTDRLSRGESGRESLWTGRRNPCSAQLRSTETVSTTVERKLVWVRLRLLPPLFEIKMAPTPP